MARAKADKQAAPVEGAVLLVVVQPIWLGERRVEPGETFEAPPEMAERLVQKGVAQRAEEG